MTEKKKTKIKTKARGKRRKKEKEKVPPKRKIGMPQLFLTHKTTTSPKKQIKLLNRFILS
jgi:hypothetical protein